jgi:Retrotransposon gag protein
MRDFKIYKIMNPLANIMKQPYVRVAMALSLIRGPKVDDWVDEQLKELEHKIHSTPKSDETLWTEFEAAFTSTFTNTAKKEDAYQKLKHLKMKDELVDDYITAFNFLAAKAGWELSNAGTIDAFCSGLRPGTLNAIMNCDVWPDTMPQWQQAAQDEMRKYLTKKAIVTIPGICAGQPDRPGRAVQTKTRDTIRAATQQRQYNESMFSARLAEALR